MGFWGFGWNVPGREMVVLRAQVVSLDRWAQLCHRLGTVVLTRDV